MAFILADVHRRGWLDPNEVQKAEQRPLAASRREAMPLSERTTRPVEIDVQLRSIDLSGLEPLRCGWVQVECQLPRFKKINKSLRHNDDKGAVLFPKISDVNTTPQGKLPLRL